MRKLLLHIINTTNFIFRKAWNNINNNDNNYDMNSDEKNIYIIYE